jgi:cytochrome c-type biogenesis protein CcmF
MIPALGAAALWIALAMALLQGTLPVIGAARGRATWMALAPRAAHACAALVALAFGCLALSFLGDDFSVLQVALHSNSTLPAPYRFAAIWAGHEGSMLLWLTLYAGWMVALARASHDLPAPLLARALGVMGWIAAGLLLFVLLTSNPFERQDPPAPNGADLDPLLQDPGMAVHPPLLYMGYVGFSVAFALAVAALIGGGLDAAWARRMRPWTTAAWCFLTVGIMLGSWWAYTVLGWGGWWFWDPVENASFMPWLAGTALIHSLAVTEKRGAFKSWTVLLALLAFALALLGTFLVRSGVLTSVHAFANDPRRGVFILVLLALVVGGALLLYALRAPAVGLGARFAPVSRESMLLANNVLLVVAMLTVLLGTLYPLLLDALGLGRISVGPPYFEAVFLPLMAATLFLLGLGPLARWKRTELPELAQRVRGAFAVSVLVGVGAAWLAGRLSLAAALGLWMSAWIVAATALDLAARLRLKERGLAWSVRRRALTRPVVGMMVAHLGVAAFALGVSMVKTHEILREVRLETGDEATLGGEGWLLRGVERRVGPNYDSVVAVLDVYDGARRVGQLRPEKRTYRVRGQVVTVAAIDRSATRDLYAALGEADGRGWTLRLQRKPFVAWIWLGCLLMATGGGIAASARRTRVRTAAAEAPAAAALARHAA